MKHCFVWSYISHAFLRLIPSTLWSFCALITPYLDDHCMVRCGYVRFFVTSWSRLIHSSVAFRKRLRHAFETTSCFFISLSRLPHLSVLSSSRLQDASVTPQYSQSRLRAAPVPPRSPLRPAFAPPLSHICHLTVKLPTRP